MPFFSQNFPEFINDPEGENFRLRVASFDSLSHDDIVRWQALANNGEGTSPFCEPEFVMPLLTNSLIPSESFKLLIMEDVSTLDWCLLSVVQNRRATIDRPISRFNSVNSLYTFLNQPMIKQSVAEPVCDAFFRILSSTRTWHSLCFRNAHLDSPVIKRLDRSAKKCNTEPISESTYERAEFRLDEVKTDDFLPLLSKTRRKKLRRAWRWMEEQGEVSFRIVKPRANVGEVANRFLELENSGWKSEAKTSLLSRENDTNFFLEMVSNFARTGRVWFGELLLNDRVIASTCNLYCNKTLFAFKIGWDPEFADGCPGYWSEIKLTTEIVKHHRQEVKIIDGCSKETSYLDSIWTNKRSIGTRYYSWSRRSKLLLLTRKQLRSIKRSSQLTLASTGTTN